MDMQEAVAGFIRLRDLKARAEAEHKEKLKPVVEAMDKLEAFMLKELNGMGGDSVKTAAGTAYKSKRVSVSVADWLAFKAFTDERGLDHMINHSANKTAVEEYLEETGQLPPGLNRSVEIVVNVRK